MADQSINMEAVETLHFAGQSRDRITPQGIGFSGLAGFFVAWGLTNWLHMGSPTFLLLVFIGFIALPMTFLSVFFNQTHLRKSSGLLDRGCPIHWQRIRLKIVGFLLTLTILASIYRLFSVEYGRGFYHPVWNVFAILACSVLLLGLPYVLWVDRRMVEPLDGYYHLGMLASGRWREVDFQLLKNHALGWIIKGFFLPFMLAGAADHLNWLHKEEIKFANFTFLYLTLLNFLFTIDVLLGAIGYLLTLRVTDSHIASTEPTCLGWASALICYPPFSTCFLGKFFSYKGTINWQDLTATQPVLFVTWGYGILLLYVIYVWATLSFGCRFSNLTNRGIIDDGPYRYTKHPAYLAKCLAWWMASLPFLVHGTFYGNFRATFCLFFITTIYTIRAGTEERHLMRDPAYRKYCEWMKENGVFAPIDKKLKQWRWT